MDERILGPELPENGYLIDPRLIGDPSGSRAPVAVPSVDTCGSPEQFFAPFHGKELNGRAFISASGCLLAADVYGGEMPDYLVGLTSAGGEDASVDLRDGTLPQRV